MSMKNNPIGMTIAKFMELARRSGHDMFYDGELDDDHGVHGCVGETCTIPWHKELREKLAKEREQK